ncbi:D-alanyl-D-alanine carboxypeptidase family protein [Halonatronum saccharophilum]|uniref:D-alanyl-D-alanine carboxypeptidase family protein n=1 Tax=Halonatronum saccharophilum TaxID=150060 RepID=UPI000487E833|nr:D-alanyl-D-alanine carboxypeptidase family protein [Halonatronum saccharophilum]
MFNFKRGMSFVLIVLLLLSPSMAYAGGNFDVSVDSAILVDAQTGQVLFAKNEHKQLPPASITKVMAILLVMEALEAGEISLEDEVTASQLASSKGGSQIWLSTGEKMSVEDLLVATIIPSANDATVALAEYIGGTKGNFVRMMNRRAGELDMENTYFANATGLPVKGGGTYTTAYDIAIMSRELAKHDLYFNWSGRRTARIRDGEYPVFTTNELIGHFAGADGLKTGWTTEAGYGLVGTADHGDGRLISVVLGAESDDERVNETIRLLSHGFRAFIRDIFVVEGTEVGSAEVDKGREAEVPVRTVNSFEAFIERGTKGDVEQEIVIDRELEAPVEEGEPVGQLVFTQYGNELGSVELVTAGEVERAGIFTLIFRWVRDFIMGFF